MRRWRTGALALVIAGLLAGGLVIVLPASPAQEAAGSPRPHRVRQPQPTSTAVPPVPTGVAPLADAASTTVPPPAAPTPPVLDDGPRSVMLIGDSMAYTAALGLAPHAPEWNFTVINEGIMGCGVVRGGPFRYFGAERQFEPRCEAWPSAWQAALDRHHPNLVAIVVGRWELMDRTHDGRWTNLFDPAFASYIETELDQAITLVTANGSRVALFTTPYYLRGLAPDGSIFPEDDPARVDAMNAILRRVAERHGVAIVDVGGWLSPEGRYTPEIAGIKVRSDGVHLTRQAGGLLAPLLFPQLRLAVG